MVNAAFKGVREEFDEEHRSCGACGSVGHDVEIIAG